MTPTLHLLSRKRRYAINEITTTNAATVVDDWRVKQQYFGATILGAKDIRNVTDLVNGLMNDGLWANMIMMMPILNNNISSQAVPITTTQWAGANQVLTLNGAWTNGNLSVNGLAGNGSQYMITGGWSANSFNLNTNTIIHYTSVVPTLVNSGYTLGALNSPGNQAMLCAAQFTDGNFKSVNGSNTGNAISAASPGAGYYCHTRTSATNHLVYFANSGTAHGQIGTTDSTTVGTTPGGGMYLFAYISNNTPTSFTQERISFIAFLNQGLTAAQSLAFFNRIQAFRTAIGGGFV